MKKIVTSLFLAVFVFVTANAQVRSVAGSVKDDKGTAVPYATVKVKGQNSAIVADEKVTSKLMLLQTQV